MASKLKVLLINQHNSGRSQIAEAYLKKYYGKYIEIESAGLEPAKEINPLVVQVMAEEGIDLSNKKPQDAFELRNSGKRYEYIIAAYYDSVSECPVFPGITNRWYWPFPDPALVKGTHEEKIEEVRNIRNIIKDWIISSPVFDDESI
ncbi:MAG: arsenate reductase ArsC [Desulfobacteraceae bacterium]|jgi:arsenate reductase